MTLPLLPLAAAFHYGFIHRCHRWANYDAYDRNPLESSYGAMDPAYGESHSAQAAAVEGGQQFMALGWCESQPAVAAGADDRGVGGGGFGCG
jgi:hypothetical protein